VAILAEPSQQRECERRGEVPAAVGDLCSAYTQNRPQHLMGHAGQQSDAPESCWDSGSRGTGCVHCSRPGLWGGRVGNHRLYPEADALQLTLRFSFQARLIPGVTPHKLECSAREEAVHETHAHHRYALRWSRGTSGG
jgi:hypothetical protein